MHFTTSPRSLSVSGRTNFEGRHNYCLLMPLKSNLLAQLTANLAISENNWFSLPDTLSLSYTFEYVYVCVFETNVCIDINKHEFRVKRCNIFSGQKSCPPYFAVGAFIKRL